MSDRELLELAAKAIGLKYHSYIEHVLIGRGINIGDLDTPIWNPLDEDGAAMRLAVSLTMMIDFITKPANAYMSGHVVAVSRAGSFYECGFSAEATRRAIVRAAAAIGKEKP